MPPNMMMPNMMPPHMMAQFGHMPHMMTPMGPMQYMAPGPGGMPMMPPPHQMMGQRPLFPAAAPAVSQHQMPPKPTFPAYR